MKFDLKKSCIIVLSLLAASCGRETPDDLSDKNKNVKLSAATLGEQVILDAAANLKLEPYVNADRRNGGRQALVCRACHSLEVGGANLIGPALHGIFGRAAGANNGFDYSPVLKNADFVWTPRALDAWLAQPGSFLPGNRMAFAGVPRRQDRDDLIAYLLDITSTGREKDN